MMQRYGVYCSLVLLLLVALVVRPAVYRPESLFLILRSASQLGMVALGQTLVMLVAGLDLSVSGVIVLNLQASWVTQGPKVAQVALYFGANDLGSTMIEENVVAATGVSHRLSLPEMRRLIETAGFEPCQRILFTTRSKKCRS